jgi:hypothetical protein
VECICADQEQELKVFRIADSLLDVVLCAPALTNGRGMLTDARDSLHSLEKVLNGVGGIESHFLGMLRKRMAETKLPAPQTLWTDLQLSLPHAESEDVEVG